ncbi:hypothetical protein TWF506_009295 [Arthrobotrys conoides]|uniref:Uncharacterized protein n=1 Tax=Arthrobotrys conoides TaxID=74498 RepID=A0AAN8PEK3_9PEZI
MDSQIDEEFPNMLNLIDCQLEYEDDVDDHDEYDDETPSMASQASSDERQQASRDHAPKKHRTSKVRKLHFIRSSS